MRLAEKLKERLEDRRWGRQCYCSISTRHYLRYVLRRIRISEINETSQKPEMVKIETDKLISLKTVYTGVNEVKLIENVLKCLKAYNTTMAVLNSMCLILKIWRERARERESLAFFEN